MFLLGRSEAKLAAERAAFLADGHAADKIDSVICDLADLTSVAAAAAEVEQKRGAAQIDILIENAGIWADRYSETADGFEIVSAPTCWGILRCAAR